MTRSFLTASAVVLARLTGLACLIAFSACSTPPAAPSPASTAPGTTDVEMLNFSGEWIEAVNAHDAQRLIGLYTDNAFLAFGKEMYAARDYFRLLEKHPTIRVIPPSNSVYIFDKDVAFMEREVEITEDINGSTESRTLKFTMALRYHNGHWRIYGHTCAELLWPGP